MQVGAQTCQCSAWSGHVGLWGTGPSVIWFLGLGILARHCLSQCQNLGTVWEPEEFQAERELILVCPHSKQIPSFTRLSLQLSSQFGNRNCPCGLSLWIIPSCGRSWFKETQNRFLWGSLNWDKCVLASEEKLQRPEKVDFRERFVVGFLVGIDSGLY